MPSHARACSYRAAGSVVHEVQSGLHLYLGFDWFYGTRNGLFGQFDGRDRVVRIFVVRR